MVIPWYLNMSGYGWPDLLTLSAVLTRLGEHAFLKATGIVGPVIADCEVAVLID